MTSLVFISSKLDWYVALKVFLKLLNTDLVRTWLKKKNPLILHWIEHY